MLKKLFGSAYHRAPISIMLVTLLAACGGNSGDSPQAASSQSSSTESSQLLALSSVVTDTTMVAEHSGKCLDVRGGPTAIESGRLIEQWSCSGEANQDWTLTHIENGKYEIRARHSGLCIEPIGGATANGTQIQQAQCKQLPRQLWRFNERADNAGRYEIVNQKAGRCLDVTGGPSATGDGVLTELWDCTGEANQTWAVTKDLPPPPPDYKSIVAKHSNKCLDVTGGPTATQDGAIIEQWSCTGEDNQAWEQRDMGNGLLSLVAKHSGKCVEVVDGNPNNEAFIQQASCNGSPQQLWTREAMSTSGEYRFKTALAGNRCLDVRGGPTATQDGARLELWDCSGEANQTWTIGAPADPTDPTDPTDPGTCAAGPYGQDATQYVCTFSDEFEGTTLDSSKWNNHASWFQSWDGVNNYQVNNGSLKIFPVAGTNYIRDYRHITTHGKYTQAYGFFEIEAKLPYGKGVWPAFWLYNVDEYPTYVPEIDIMEAYPGNGYDGGWATTDFRPIQFASTVWRNDNEQVTHKTLRNESIDLSAGFHKYAVKWEPTKMTFYFDGQPFHTVNVSFSKQKFIILSLQFGSASGPGDASTPTGPGNAFDIRYMRAWRLK